MPYMITLLNEILKQLVNESINDVVSYSCLPMIEFEMPRLVLAPLSRIPKLFNAFLD